MTVPADCITRRELQALVSRTGELTGRASGELSLLLHRLGAAAAAVEGYLDEHAPDGVPRSKAQARVFANPHGWETTWLRQSIAAFTADGEIRVGIDRQLLLSPHPGRRFVVTGRYRLTLGGEALKPSADKAALRAAVDRYLGGFSAVPAFVPAFVEDMLDSYEGDSRAVRQQETDETVLRQEEAG